MKVLKQPKPKDDPSLIYQITCNNKKCAAEFEALESELRAVHDQRDGDALVLKCQFCNTETWVTPHQE